MILIHRNVRIVLIQKPTTQQQRRRNYLMCNFTALIHYIHIKPPGSRGNCMYIHTHRTYVRSATHRYMYVYVLCAGCVHRACVQPQTTCLPWTWPRNTLCNFCGMRTRVSVHVYVCTTYNVQLYIHIFTIYRRGWCNLNVFVVICVFFSILFFFVYFAFAGDASFHKEKFELSVCKYVVYV